jgi:hypothetical protein
MSQEHIAKLDSDPTVKVDIEVDPSEHDAWKSSWTNSFQLHDFVDEDDLEWLTEHMLKRHKKFRVKESGTLHFFSDLTEIEDRFFDKWKTVIPELEKTGHWEGNFVVTSSPYNLHIDTGRPEWLKERGVVPGRQIIIPLWVCHTNKEYKGTGKTPPAGTVIFKNRFIKYGTNFAKSDNQYDTDVFYTVRNYSNLTCYNQDGSVWDVDWNKPIDPDIRKEYLSHYPARWCDGMEFEAMYNWDRGSLIAFDRCQAHSGMDFPKNQVTMKAGLSLMTTRKL